MRFRVVRSCILVLAVFAFPGCASTPDETDDARRAKIEADIHEWGISNNPAVERQRAEIEAALAREDTSPIFDAIELRAAAVHETDEKLQMLARVPLENLFNAREKRGALEARTNVEIAKLGEVSLEQRVRLCGPSLDRLVHEERLEIFDRFAKRQQALLTWNRELREAGLLDEVGAERFELSGRVSLARSRPEAPPPDAEVEANKSRFPALPSLEADNSILLDDAMVVRAQLLSKHPAVDVHRAIGKRYEALERSERTNRYPSLRFIDFGFEPTTFPGQKRQYDAQIALQIPFGREAGASERRYRALAVGRQSAERALVETHVRETRAALEEINRFRRRSADWIALLERADAAEKVADRWQQGRLADPSAIARLLDEVYDARISVLDARERAGHAGCAVLATTGTSVEEWPL